MGSVVISVVTVVRNDVAGLKSTLLSLQDQGGPFEWVIVDGILQ